MTGVEAKAKRFVQKGKEEQGTRMEKGKDKNGEINGQRRQGDKTTRREEMEKRKLRETSQIVNNKKQEAKGKRQPR